MLKRFKVLRNPAKVLLSTVAVLLVLFVIYYVLTYRQGLLPRGPEDELRDVQLAVNAMMEHRGTDSLPKPISASKGWATNDMSAFPDVVHGHVLWDAHIPGESGPLRFCNTRETDYYYTCDENGVISQWSDTSIEDATLLGTGSV